MQRLIRQRLILAAVIVVLGCLAAGCGSTVKSVISSLPSRTASVLPTQAPTSPPTQAPTSPPVTASPTPEPTTQPAATPAPAASTPPAESSNNLVWLWIALGAIVLIGVVVWIVRSSGRRSATAADWRSRVIDAYAKGSALYDAMSVAEAAGPAAADAGARWSDIQRRADDLAQNLYALREAAPDEDARDRVADAIAALQGVRSAMEAEHRPGGAGAEHAEVVRGRLSFFDAAIRALRSAGERLV